MTNQDIKTRFDRDGIVTPIDILSEPETDFYRGKLMEFLDKSNWQLDAVNRHKPHLYLKWANDLGRHPKILNAIKPLLGSDILMWYSVIFVKPARSEGFVPWHQDATYWALTENLGLTVWIALSPVNESNGCVEYSPASHVHTNYQHEIDNSEKNLLARGQLIKGFDQANTVKAILNPGQASIHHVSTLHFSKPNPSDRPRLGIAFRYIPAHVYPKTLTWLKRSATTVCGDDKLKKFTKDVVPKVDYDPEGLRAHKKSVRIAAIHTLFGDSSRTSWRKIFDLVPILVTRKTLKYFKYLGLPVSQSNDS